MRAVVPDSHTKANGPFFSLSFSLSSVPFPRERDTHTQRKKAQERYVSLLLQSVT